MATLPVSEVNDLREKSDRLAKLEQDYSQLESAEKDLHTTIEDMRSGTNPCGHDLEIQDLKDKLNKFNNAVQVCLVFIDIFK